MLCGQQGLVSVPQKLCGSTWGREVQGEISKPSWWAPGPTHTPLNLTLIRGSLVFIVYCNLESSINFHLTIKSDYSVM